MMSTFNIVKVVYHLWIHNHFLVSFPEVGCTKQAVLPFLLLSFTAAWCFSFLSASSRGSRSTSGFSDLWQNFNYPGRISMAVTSVGVRNVQSCHAARSAPWASSRTVMAVLSASAEVSVSPSSSQRGNKGQKGVWWMGCFKWLLSVLKQMSLTVGPSHRTPFCLHRIKRAWNRVYSTWPS